jgi:hypothetical protein
VVVSFLFRLWSEDGEAEPSIAFEDSTSPGLVPLWEEVGVYDALYNSDGRQARDISRAIAYAVDRIADDASLGRLLPPTVTVQEALRFLENVHRACVIHASARVETR